ncbi:MAG: hypothetical protein IT210_16870 [Armatimonadetes bacterium]|nr:hypothetical protein [Armatimonadota bacterium]
MLIKRKIPLPALLLLGLLATSAWANDTDLTYGGSPSPLAGHPSVAMRSEYVKMVVGDEDVTVDCRFTFVNKGPACRVRMGFPDEGGDPGEDPDATPHPPKGTFKAFRSWVNGKPVPTTVIRGKEPGSVWHVKEVSFPTRRTVKVRNRYTVPVGSSVAFRSVLIHLTQYVLHTGSSWHGLLGRSEIEVVFRRKGMTGAIAPRAIRWQNGQVNYDTTAKIGKRTVYYEGPCPPRVSGNTLRFIRTRWRPAPKDDILLVFDIERLKTGS